MVRQPHMCWAYSPTCSTLVDLHDVFLKSVGYGTGPDYLVALVLPDLLRHNMNMAYPKLSTSTNRLAYGPQTPGMDCEIRRRMPTRVQILHLPPQFRRRRTLSSGSEDTTYGRTHQQRPRSKLWTWRLRCGRSRRLRRCGRSRRVRRCGRSRRVRRCGRARIYQEVTRGEGRCLVNHPGLRVLHVRVEAHSARAN